MIMDWKLPGSGEFGNERYDEIRYQNLQSLDESSLWHAIKFVCKDNRDYQVAQALYLAGVPTRYRDSFIWYYGKVWDGEITDAELAERVMRDKLPWRMNVQLHNYIWDPQERGR